MSVHFEVAVLVGSLRSASITRRVDRALIANAPSSLRCKLTEIGDLPLYNEDLEGRVPTWSRFRGEITGSDAVLFVTPEYNRSLPGCLKNAIDVGSRSSDKSAWKGKAAGVVSAAPHNLGGFGANLAVRQSLVYLNMPVMQQPEAYISNAADLFGEDGSVKSEATQDFIRTFMSAYGQWVAKIAVSPAG